MWKYSIERLNPYNLTLDQCWQHSSTPTFNRHHWLHYCCSLQMIWTPPVPGSPWSHSITCSLVLAPSDWVGHHMCALLLIFPAASI